MSIYIDFHVLQTVPPSCVNRDDTGSPKTAIYGGAVRARVSSQAWKHVMRESFKDLFKDEDIGCRTKFVAEMVEDEMLASDSSLDKTECHKKAVEALNMAGLTVKSAKKGETEKADALFFMSKKQAKAIAEYAIELNLKDKKEAEKVLKNALKENPSVDIALFGRMAANDPTLNYDASAQVAHAISTHAVENEYDYFTAVDDRQTDDNAGAGHLGTVEFNSSTLYRYATVNVSELSETIGAENAAETVKNFADAFVYSMPTGKSNSFANRTMPDSVYITVRKDQPVNLCGAFEAPVKKSDRGYASESEKKLEEYAETVYRKFAAEPEKAFCTEGCFDKIAETLSLPEMLSELEKTVNDMINEV